MTSLRTVLRAIFRHDAMNAEMNDEMRQHLAQATDLLVARGMSRADAERQARREFGNLGVLTEDGRDARGAGWVETLRGDLRYAVRALRAAPAFTAVAIASLAIGIGANTAIFSLINSIVLRPLPVSRPEEIVSLVLDKSNPYFTNPIFEGLRTKTAGIGSIAAQGGGTFNLASGGEERPVRASYISGEYFATLGVRPATGRLIGTTDDQRGCPSVAVVSHRFWKTQMGSRPDVVGSRIALTDKPHTIIGVAEEGFTGIEVGNPASIFVPLCLAGSLDARSHWWLTLIARLEPGRSADQASAQLGAIARGVLENAAPTRFDAKRRAEFVGMSITAVPAATGMSDLRAQYEAQLFLLLGMVGVVLLISCANVANLMLARATARGREIAIRVAIGASRTRLVRQMLTESLVLAIVAAAVGLLLAQWTGRLLVGLIGAGPDAIELAIDVRVLGFTAAVALATVLICGLVPALRATRIDPHVLLKSGASRSGSSRYRIGKGLVIVQCALALVVVSAAGLLTGTFARLSRVSAGFDPRGVVIASMDLKREKQGLGENIDLQRAILDGLRQTNGIRSASLSILTPIGRTSWNNLIAVDGFTPTREMDALAWFNGVSDDYFRTLRTRVLQGREFTAADTKTSGPVAIINQSAARHFFGDRPVIGQTFRVDRQGKLDPPVTIVGLVEDAKYRSLREEREPIVYIPAAQDDDSWASPTYLVRSDLPAGPTIAAVKGVAARIDSRISLRFTTLSDQVAASLQQERLLAILSAFFGGIALLLAMIGLYGVMAYTVARRRTEIGVRIALGADRSRVVGMVLGDVGRLLAVGAVVGLVGALLVNPVLRKFLFDMEPNDPLVLAGALVTLAVGALLAGALPARRAAGLQPIEALRED